MDVCLFLPLEAPIYPALQALDLTGVPAPIDGPTFFRLRRSRSAATLVLWLILFQKRDARLLEFRLSHYTYAQKDVDDPDGTPAGWHIPIAAPSTSPKELSLLLRDAASLAPLLAQPGCLDAAPVRRQRLVDGNLSSSGGVPRLKALRVVGQAQSMCASLATLLTDIHVPLRSVHLEFIFAPVPTCEALARSPSCSARQIRSGTSARSPS